MFKDLIEGFVKDQIKKQITETIGISNDKADGAIHDVIGSLVGGLAKNTTSEKGKDSLWTALDKDHDGSLLDDAISIVGSDNKGDAIVRHIFGSKEEMIAKVIGKKYGLNSTDITRLMAIISPIIMGYLGKKKNQDSLDPSGIARLLAGEKEEIAKEKEASPLLSFIDQDGDGDVDINDVFKLMS